MNIIAIDGEGETSLFCSFKNEIISETVIAQGSFQSRIKPKKVYSFVLKKSTITIEKKKKCLCFVILL